MFNYKSCLLIPPPPGYMLSMQGGSRASSRPPEMACQVLPPCSMMRHPWLFPLCSALAQHSLPRHISSSSLAPSSFLNSGHGKGRSNSGGKSLDRDGCPLFSCCLRQLSQLVPWMGRLWEEVIGTSIVETTFSHTVWSVLFGHLRGFFGCASINGSQGVAAKNRAFSVVVPPPLILWDSLPFELNTAPSWTFPQGLTTFSFQKACASP